MKNLMHEGWTSLSLATATSVAMATHFPSTLIDVFSTECSDYRGGKEGKQEKRKTSGFSERRHHDHSTQTSSHRETKPTNHLRTFVHDIINVNGTTPTFYPVPT